MESAEQHQIAATLMYRAGSGANAVQIADAFLLICQQIDSVLCPIVGQTGVAALYKRSLYLTGKNFPWLANSGHTFESPIEYDTLKNLLSEQNAATAHAGGSALLQTLYELLASMVGPSLTERLLRSLWVDAAAMTPIQEIPR